MAYSWIIYSCLIFGTGILCDRKIESQQAASSCLGKTDAKYQCSNKQCIDWSSVCDGPIDCSDGSDENKYMCARYEYGTMGCGRESIKNQFISNNSKKDVKVETAPWYVGVTKLNNSGYVWKCGGSIIAPNVVISVARCFWESGMLFGNIIPVNNSLYRIEVGAYNRHLTNITNNVYTQILKVKRIYLAEGYSPKSRNDGNDIAVIVLANDVSFSNGHAEPLCIDWRSKYNVVNGDEGKVLVQNVTASFNSEHLENNYAFIDYSTCNKLYPKIYRNTLPQNIFCARKKSASEKGINGDGKGRGVEGTGISFLHFNSYFLTGLRSRKHFMDNDYFIEVHTDIQYHIPWIRGILNKHSIENSCVLPTVEGVVYSYINSNEILPHGTLIDPNLNVTENCEVGYHKAFPSRFRVCQEDGKWLTNSEKLCFKMCPPLLPDSLDIKCSYNAKNANCSNSSIPGTIAKLSCKSTHSASNRQDGSPKESICQSNGLWNKPLYRCTQIQSEHNASHQNTVISTLNSYSAKEMCQNYSETINFRRNCSKSILLEAVNDTKRYDCYDAISNQTAAEPKEFPHMALLGYDENKDMDYWLYGGSLISNRFVLTAAHCEKYGVGTQTRKAIWARLGELDFSTETDDARPTDYKIVQRIIHPNYSSPSHYNDIALFRLEKDVVFSEFVRPICLNTETGLRPPKIIATGWGRPGTTDPQSPHLLKVRLNTISAEECDKYFLNMINRNKSLVDGIVDKSLLCSGNSEDGNYLCGRDGGGPIQITHESYKWMYSQIAISAFSWSFCGEDSPSVYTQVSNYISWIEKIVWPKM